MEINRTEILKAKPGDIIWFNIGDASDAEIINFIQGVIEILPNSVYPIVTRSDMVSSIKISSIDELRRLRDSIDEVIVNAQLESEYGD